MSVEAAGKPTHLLLDQVGTRSGPSQRFTPSGARAATPQAPAQPGVARVLVEWACASGGSVAANVSDGSGDISGPLGNGFEVPILTTHPPERVIWRVTGSCSWHVRAIDQ